MDVQTSETVGQRILTHPTLAIGDPSGKTKLRLKEVLLGEAMLCYALDAR